MHRLVDVRAVVVTVDGDVAEVRPVVAREAVGHANAVLWCRERASCQSVSLSVSHWTKSTLGMRAARGLAGLVGHDVTVDDVVPRAVLGVVPVDGLERLSVDRAALLDEVVRSRRAASSGSGWRSRSVAVAEETTELVLVSLGDRCRRPPSLLKRASCVDGRDLAVEHTGRAEVVRAEREHVLGGLTRVLHRGRVRPHLDEVLLLVLRDGVEPAGTDAASCRPTCRPAAHAVLRELLRVGAEEPVLRAEVPRVRRGHEVVAERDGVTHLVRDDGVVDATTKVVLHLVGALGLDVRVRPAG